MLRSKLVTVLRKATAIAALSMVFGGALGAALAAPAGASTAHAVPDIRCPFICG